MSALLTRVERAEKAAGVNRRCPECATCVPTPADAPPDDYITGTCCLCGAATNYYCAGWSEREREAGAVIASTHFGARWRDRRTAALSCWFDRRVKERGQAETQELERVRRRAVTDPAAGVYLALLEKAHRAAGARWEAAIEEASDETLVLIVEIEDLSDEELERIIWPPA